jgi:hypothetical protein
MQSVLGGGVVTGGAEVGDDGVVLEGHEGVGDALGDVDGAELVGVEDRGVPGTEGGGADADVDDDVE